MNLPRCSGVLLHPTCLPSQFGIGDFGDQAYQFVEQLIGAGQTIWQMLPLGPTGYGDSPYQLFSAFAGNPLFIGLERLVRDGLLEAGDLESAPEFPLDTVEYERVNAWKLPLLAKAYRIFRDKSSPLDKLAFENFCRDQAAWLDDYALFISLKNALGANKSWTDWDKDLVERRPAALAQWREKLAHEMECRKYWQFEFYRQWDALRKYSNERGLRLMGDIPIYVAHDSSDVWAHPEHFHLDEQGNPTVVAGVPRVVEVKGMELDAPFAAAMIYVNNLDKPGFIGRLGSLLAENNINIATFNLGRVEAGEDAIALVGVDQTPSAAVMDKIKATANVKEVRALAF